MLVKHRTLEVRGSTPLGSTSIKPCGYPCPQGFPFVCRGVPRFPPVASVFSPGAYMP